MRTNLVVIHGNLTRAAELKYWDNQTAYCEFSLAVNESYKDKQTGEWKDIPSYFDCTLRGKGAEVFVKSLTKGRGVTVTGSLKQNRWESNGQKFSRVIIKVENLDFDRPSDSGANQQNYHPTEVNMRGPAPQDTYQEADFVPFDDNQLPEDIPF